jgi:hypothetical protein
MLLFVASFGVAGRFKDRCLTSGLMSHIFAVLQSCLPLADLSFLLTEVLGGWMFRRIPQCLTCYVGLTHDV